MAEAWQRGPIEGVQPILNPAAAALIQAREEIEGAVAGLTDEQLWARPGGAASVGFHLRHLAGSTDRLLTYAAGAPLSETQMKIVRAEKEPRQPGEDLGSLVAGALSAIDRALATLRATDPAALHDARTVGRAKIPVTVYGLLGHIAEHTTRHAGQIIATSTVVRALHP